MAKRRTIAVGSATILASLAIATTAQAANVATITLYGTGTGSLATYGCPARAWSSASQDAAGSSAILLPGCKSVSVKIYYTNNKGFAGWSGTTTDPDYAQRTLNGSDELQKSYHTAIANATSAQ